MLGNDSGILCTDGRSKSCMNFPLECTMNAMQLFEQVCLRVPHFD